MCKRRGSRRAIVCAWGQRTKRSRQFSPLPRGYWAWTQVPRLGSKCLYPLSPLTDPIAKRKRKRKRKQPFLQLLDWLIFNFHFLLKHILIQYILITLFLNPPRSSHLLTYQAPRHFFLSLKQITPPTKTYKKHTHTKPTVLNRIQKVPKQSKMRPKKKKKDSSSLNGLLLNPKLHKKKKTKKKVCKNIIESVLCCVSCWAWGLSWNVGNIPSESPLMKT